jgi:hypothetical protein
MNFGGFPSDVVKIADAVPLASAALPAAALRARIENSQGPSVKTNISFQLTTRQPLGSTLYSLFTWLFSRFHFCHH